MLEENISDYVKLTELQALFAEFEEKLTAEYEKWEELSEKLSAM